jgi:hypothetical protein
MTVLLSQHNQTRTTTIPNMPPHQFSSSLRAHSKWAKWAKYEAGQMGGVVDLLRTYFDPGWHKRQPVTDIGPSERNFHTTLLACLSGESRWLNSSYASLKASSTADRHHHHRSEQGWIMDVGWYPTSI